MIKIIAQPTEIWTLRKIQSLLSLETVFLKRQIRNTQNKIGDFERLHRTPCRDSLYGHVDDMELLEWEGEIETLRRLERKLTSLKEISFEYSSSFFAAGFWVPDAESWVLIPISGLST